MPRLRLAPLVASALFAATSFASAPPLAHDPGPAAGAQAAPAAGETDIARDALSLSLRALAAAERGSIDVDVKDATLVELFEQVQSRGSLPLRIDWESLAGLGIAKDDRIDFHIRDVPPLAALRAIAAAIPAEFDQPVVDACSGQLVLTSPSGLAALRETAIYDIADILADPTLLEAKAAPAAVAAPAGDDEDAPISEGVAVETPLDSMAERLVEIISEHIDPEGWIDTGGSRGRMTSEAGRLIVSATPATHRGLTAFLASLRSQAPTRATITWTIARVPSGQVGALRAAMQKGHANGVGPRSALEAIDGLVIESSPRTTTLIGESATIESSGPDVLTRCVARPSFDRIARTFGAMVRIEITRGDRKASAEASLSGDANRAADVIELASGPVDGTTWVVVVEAVADRPGATQE